MRALLFFILVTGLSDDAFASVFTLVGKCSGWKTENGHAGEVRILYGLDGGRTALVVFDKLTGKSYGEDAFLVNASNAVAAQLQLSRVRDPREPLGPAIELLLKEGKSIPTKLVDNGRSVPVTCTYGSEYL